MHRLFVALRPPPAIRALLGATTVGVPGARWQDDAQLHLTLRYIGEVERAVAEDVVAALGHIHASPVEARIAGVGAFDKGGRTTALWAAVAPPAPLAELHRKVDRALGLAGLPPERRAFVPHVTLARLSRGAGAGAEIARWQVAHAALTSAPFRFDQIVLYESHLTPDGSDYHPVERWPLAVRTHSPS